jgi:integrase
MAGRSRRGFGAIRKLPSKRWQASYVGPDEARHTAPNTFATKMEAEGWLLAERRVIDGGDWTPPKADPEDDAPAEEAEVTPPPTLAEWSQQWLSQRELRATTRDGYERLLDNHILPPLGALPLDGLSRTRLRTWYAGLDPKTPRARSKAYSLLRSILNAAIDAELITGPNPCQIRGAGVSARVHKIEPLTVDQLEALVSAMPERLRMAVLLGCWGALRYGEIAELRRKDIDAARTLVKVRRGVTWTNGKASVGPPKTSAGIRDVHLPAFLAPALADHLARFAQPGPDGLLFPSATGQHIWAPTFAKPFREAREAAGRPDLRVHDLRHTGAVLAAQTGATLAELMARLGHTTPAMAMRYQHAATGADQRIAHKLDQLRASQHR